MNNQQQQLIEEVRKLLNEVNNELRSLKIETGRLQQMMSGSTSRRPIGIDEVCAILGKAKPTVYALACKRLRPCYKSGKKLYFYEDEIIAWIEQGRRSTMGEIRAKALKIE